jgi:hypothetical protein
VKSFSPAYAERQSFSVKNRTLKSLAILFLLCLFMTVFAAPVIAQEATIVGTATDPSGSVVPYVAITVTRQTRECHVETNAVAVQSDSGGSRRQ